MLFNVLVFLLIVLVTMYLATQGMVSSLIALATSIFSSILAMALLEPLQGIIGGFSPNYARGATLLLLFLLVFSATRIISDMLIKKSIKMKPWVDRIAGGVFGFFTALVVLGTLIIGIEMLPVQRTLLGYDSFPAATVMQAVDSDGKPVYGEVTSRRTGVWFSPDGFVLTLWNAAAGRSLGGSRSWDSVHPDITAENYGYRYPVFAGSSRVAPSDLVNVKEVWTSSDPKEYQARGIPLQNGKNTRVVVVRVEVKKGEKEPHVTFDSDGYLRVSAAQVRLVTTGGRQDVFHQFYPIGDMFQGRAFEPLALDGGFIVDDYVTKGGASAALEDWVFAIPEDEKPSLFEMKGAHPEAFADLVKDKPSAPLKVAEYPPRDYYKDLCTYTVTFDPGPGDPKVVKLVSGRVYVLKPTAQMRDIFPLLKPAYQNVLQTMKDMEANTNGWTTPLKQGLPGHSAMVAAQRMGVNHNGDPDDQNVPWSDVLPVILLGQVTPDPRQNLVTMPAYMKQTVEAAWNSVRSGSIISGVADADPSTLTATVRRISPTPHTVVITLETETSYYVWIKEPEFAPPAAATKPKRELTDLVTADPSSSPIFHIDLSEKPAQ